MTPPDASWFLCQLFAQAMANPDEPRPGSANWNPAKWHRAWVDCVALSKQLREGTELGNQARAIASGANWGNQV